jgi:hypothetical protein
MEAKGILLFCFLLLHAPIAWSSDDVPPPPPAPKDRKTPVTKAEYFVFTCKIYINEDGTARTVEVLSTNPPMNMQNRSNKEFIESIVSSVRTWTFNPKMEDGKPVAGYAIVPVSVDLAEPYKIGGGT